MATSKRDVRLGVEIETTGEEGIRRLAQDVRALGKEGGDAAPEFLAITRALDQLADQAGAITSLKALTEQVNKLGIEQREAAAAADLAAAKYVEQKAATDQLRAAATSASQSVDATKVALAEARAALSNYTAGQDAATKKTLEYRSKVRELTEAVNDQKTTLATRNVELGPTPANSRPNHRALTAGWRKRGFMKLAISINGTATLGSI
jgi:ABC-type transporter Mla subunit MlaD